MTKPTARSAPRDPAAAEKLLRKLVADLETRRMQPDDAVFGHFKEGDFSENGITIEWPSVALLLDEANIFLSQDQ